MRPTALLTLLAVFVLACESVSPEPTLYAPDDLASVLPQQVGDLTLELEGAGGSDYLIETLGEEALELLLVCEMPNARCAPERVHFALASSDRDPSQPRLVMFAVRVEGVPSWELDASHGNPYVLVTPADADEYRPLVQEIILPESGWLSLYPLGEVLFGAVATTDELDVTAADVSAALPTCRRRGNEFCDAPG